MFPEYVHLTELVHISAEVDATNLMFMFVFLFSISKCLFLILENLSLGFIMFCSCLKVFGWGENVEKLVYNMTSIKEFCKGKA